VQVVPWGDAQALAVLQRRLSVDILVTGHTHEYKVYPACGLVAISLCLQHAILLNTVNKPANFASCFLDHIVLRLVVHRRRSTWTAHCS